MGISKTITEILEQIRDVLDSDTTLSEWCTSQFSKQPSVYLGFDPSSDGKTDSSGYPLIVILDSHNQRGTSQGELPFVIDIGLTVWNATRTVSGNKVTYEGFLQVEGFREQVENALFSAKPRIHAGVDLEGGYDREETQHPRHVSYIVVTPKGLKKHNEPLP